MPGPIILPQLPPLPKYPVKPVPIEPSPPPEPVTKKRTRIGPEAILVSGLAFPRERGQKIRDVFSNYCKTMAKRLNIKYPGIIITVFNFFEGTQQFYEFDGKSPEPIISLFRKWDKFKADNYRYYNWGTMSIEVKKPGPEAFRPGINENEDNVYYYTGISDVFGSSSSVPIWDFEDALIDGKFTEKSISIEHVYRYIEALGRYNTGNLKELHFFSRGESSSGSPILVRSAAQFLHKKGKYKIKYSEKYIVKDGAPADFYIDPSFTPSYTTEAITSFNNFNAAFSKDSITVLWGSFLNRDAYKLIDGVIHSKEYKKMLKDPGDKLFDYLGTPMSLNDVIEEVHEKYVVESYAHRLGVVTAGNVYFAPPGTDANTDNEKTQKRHGDPLLHIFMGEDYGDPPGLDFRGILKFYHEVIGTNFLINTPSEYHKTYGRGYIKIF